MKVLFIHRSVGQNILEDSKLRYKFDGIRLYDIYANKCRFTNSEGVIEEAPFPIEEGKTEPEDLADFFQNAEAKGYEQALREFDCVILKSCYTANSLKSDKHMQSQVEAYIVIKEYIENHPDQHFIVCTTPPRIQICTTAKAVNRAKTMQNWILENFEPLPNTDVLDIFGMLTSDRGVLDKKYRRFAFYDQHPNRAGSLAIAAELEKLLNGLNQYQKRPALRAHV